MVMMISKQHYNRLPLLMIIKTIQSVVIIIIFLFLFK